MNYKFHYKELIKSRRARVLSDLVYTEKHHIIPKSWGGSNDGDNMIRLTAREHYVAHLLLFKMSTGRHRSKMGMALACFCIGGTRREKLTAVQYESAKVAAMGMRAIHMSGERNPFYGKRHDDATREKMRKNQPDKRGKLNPMFGRRHSPEARAIMSQKNTGQCMGDVNPSKRPEVREKIRKSKMGHKNPQARTWKLTSPDNEVYIINGGIKRILPEYNLTYNMFTGNGKKFPFTHKSGWTLDRIK